MCERGLAQERVRIGEAPRQRLACSLPYERMLWIQEQGTKVLRRPRKVEDVPRVEVAKYLSGRRVSTGFLFSGLGVLGWTYLNNHVERDVWHLRQAAPTAP